MAKPSTPDVVVRRRSGGISKSAADKLARGKEAAQAAVRRVRENKEHFVDNSLGFAAGHVLSGYYGKKLAERSAQGASMNFPRTNISYGKGGGIALFALGVSGMMGSDRASSVAAVAGAQLYGADRGVESYLARAAELAAGDGGEE